MGKYHPYHPVSSRTMCAFKTCQNDGKRSKLRFFHFPRVAGERLEKWIINCGEEDLRPHPPSLLRFLRVCQLHFTPECFTSTLLTRITKFAVPTLDVTSEEYLKALANLPQSNNFEYKCCVKGCFTDNEICFDFPKNDVLRQLWLKRCGNIGSFNLLDGRRRKRVCRKHFASHAFADDQRTYLRFDAVPSIFSHNPPAVVTNDTIPATESTEVPLQEFYSPASEIVTENNIPVIESTEEVPLQEYYSPTPPAEESDDILMDEYNSTEPTPANEIDITQECLAKLEDAIHIQTSNSPLELNSELSTVPQNESKKYFNVEDFLKYIMQPNSDVGENQAVTEQSAKKPRDFVLASCGLPGCNDSLYSDSKTVKKLVKCSSKCKRYFHLPCTGLQKEEYEVLCNTDALRWFCAECRKFS